MKAADRAALAVLAAVAAPRAELARAFDVIRRHDDESVFAALGDRPRGKAAAGARRDDDLVVFVRDRLAPLLASAQDKADALADGFDGPALRRRGLAATVRALAAVHGDEAVRAAAVKLIARIAAGAGRESPP